MSKFLYPNMSKAELKIIEMKKKEKFDWRLEKKLTLAENETGTAMTHTNQS